MASDMFDELKHGQIGRPEDQPLVFAVLIALIALTLVVFL